MATSVDVLVRRIESLEKKVKYLEFSLGTVENLLLEFLEEVEPTPEERRLMSVGSSPDSDYVPLHRIKGEINAEK